MTATGPRPHPVGVRVAFVHELDDPQACDGAHAVIALTPVAYRDCARAGLRPTVLDDHVRRSEVDVDVDAYLRWQLDWIDRLGSLTGPHRDAVVAGTQLVKVPLDSVVNAARLLRAAAETCRATEIVYVGRTGAADSDPFHHGHLQFCPLLGDRPLASRLLAPVARAVGAEFTTHAVERPALEGQPDPPPVLRRAREWAARWVGPYRRGRIGLIGRGRPRTLMTWYSGYGAPAFARAERARGRRPCYLLRGAPVTRIVDPALFGGVRGRPVAVRPAPTRTHPAPDDLAGLLAEVDHWAGTPGAGDALVERLQFFLSAVAPKIDATARALGDDFGAAGVIRVAAANASSIEEFGAVLAAARTGLDRILVQHGDHLLPYDFWLVSETRGFTDMYVSDPTIPADLGAAANRIGASPPVFHQASPRLTGQRQPTRRQQPAGVGPVCYLPGFLVGDTAVINAAYYDSAWYHRWHLRLLDLMGSHPEIPFIWKALPTADQAHDPIADVLADGGPGNVSYVTTPFPDVLPGIARVISDYPSTGLYETVRAGKPVLALSFATFGALRRSAAAIFAPVLRVCEDEDQGLEAVETFLATDPGRWILPPVVLG